MVNVREQITKLLNELRQKQGSENSVVPQQINLVINLSQSYLDALARLLAGKKDVCVAVCYNKSEEKIWIANNFRKALYAEKYLNILRKYIISVENKNWNQRKVELEELLWLAIDNISEKNIIFTKDLNERSEDSSEWTKLIKELKEEKKVKEVNLIEMLKKLSEFANKLLIKIKKLEGTPRFIHYSNYLMPLYDLNFIVGGIDNNREEMAKIIEAIKSENGVKFISGSSNKCDKRICKKCQWNELKKNQKRKEKTSSEVGSEEAKVVECSCDKIDRDFRFCNYFKNECSICLENSVHAEMKIINEFYHLNQKIEEDCYIGINKLCCFPCKKMLEIIFDEVKSNNHYVYGVHGLIYANWIIPNNIPSDKKEKLKKYLVDFFETFSLHEKKWDTTGKLPENVKEEPLDWIIRLIWVGEINILKWDSGVAPRELKEGEKWESKLKNKESIVEAEEYAKEMLRDIYQKSGKEIPIDLQKIEAKIEVKKD